MGSRRFRWPVSRLVSRIIILASIVLILSPVISSQSFFFVVDADTPIDITVNPSKIVGENTLSLGFMLDHEWDIWINSATKRELANDASFKLVRLFDFRSDGPQPCQYWYESTKTGKWDWTSIDRLVDMIFEAGAEPLICLGGINFANGVPIIPSGMAINSSSGLPYPASFAAYAKAWVSHFAGRERDVRFYEIFNEPAHYFGYGVDPLKLDNYITVWNAAAREMRQVKSGLMISQDHITLRKVLDTWITKGDDVDYIDFHKYDSDGINKFSDDEMFARVETVKFSTDGAFYGAQAAQQKWQTTRGKKLPILLTESNFNSYYSSGTDPKIQQIAGTVWLSLVLRKSILTGLSYYTYYSFCSSPDPDKIGQGFGMVNSDNNKPWYPYYLQGLIGNNLGVGDSLVESASSSGEIATLAWLHNQILNVLVICKTDSQRTVTLNGVEGQLNVSKLDNTVSWINAQVQSSIVYAANSITLNGYTVMLLQQKQTLVTYRIAASVGVGGSISPSGSVVVNYGFDQSFTITPETGYEIADVIVDGSSVGAVSTHTFNNVEADHMITASFDVVTPSDYLFEDGFESGSFSAWTSASATSGETAECTTYAHHGSYGAYFTSDGGGGYERAYCYETIADSQEVFARGYFYVQTSGLTDEGDRVNLITFKAGSNNVAYASLVRTKGLLMWRLTVRNGASYSVSFSTSTASVSAWYCVELHWVDDAVDGYGELYVDGVKVCVLYSQNTAFYGQVGQVRLGLSELVNSGATSLYLDCAVISESYIGPETVPVYLFEDGFESGSFSAWTSASATSGETASIASTLWHHGSRSAIFTSNGGGGSEKSRCYTSVSSLSDVYVQGYFRVTTSGIAENDDRFYLLDLRNGGNRVASVGWRLTDGVLRWVMLIRHGTGYAVDYSAAVPALNTWYCVELHWKQDATTGLGELWVDGVKVCSATGRNTAVYGSVTQVAFGLAELTNCASTTVYGDCAKISKTYIGPEESTPVTWKIAASAGAGGSISPSGSVVVNDGANQAFTITPATGYQIANVIVDGSSVGPVSTYTFNNVAADHTIAASFELLPVALFTDGFESGDFDAFTGKYTTTGTATVTSTQSHSGSYSAQFSVYSSSAVRKTYCYETIEAQSELHASAYVYISSGLPVTNGQTVWLIQFWSSDGSTAASYGVRGSASGTMWTVQDGSYPYSMGTSGPVEGGWHLLQAFYTKAASGKTIVLTVDGVEVASLSQNTSGDSGVVNARFGLCYCQSTQATTIHIDDIKIS